MRPASLLGILLECLDLFDQPGNFPADVRLAKMFREKRFLGSKDRRFIGEAAFGWLRHGRRGKIRWRLWRDRNGIADPAGRRDRFLGPLLALAADGLLPWPAAELAAAAMALEQLDRAWEPIFEAAQKNLFLDERDWPADPLERLAAECSLPRWVMDRLVASEGGEAARRLGLALLEPAPVDLRVYLSRLEREVVRRELEEEFGAVVEATPLSPAGLRLKSRLNLKGFLKDHPAWAEVQDEGSQIAVLATEAAAGETVIEACAGGGGKTLALVDLMRGKGKIHACDVDARKLFELERRAAPLGFRGLVTHGMTAEGALPQRLPPAADLVVIDAPCSGLGTLRRNPHLKWRLSEADVAAHARLQAEILNRFARRVRPGGRLVYITCSILSEENEAVAEAFLKEHPSFQKFLPAVAARLPAAAVSDGYLKLDPARAGTDGFFIAGFKNRPLA